MASSYLPGFDLQRAWLIGARRKHARARRAERHPLFLLAIVELHDDDRGRVVVAGRGARAATKLSARRFEKSSSAPSRLLESTVFAAGRDLLPCVDRVFAGALDALERARLFAARNLEARRVEGPEVEHFLAPEVVDLLLQLHRDAVVDAEDGRLRRIASPTPSRHRLLCRARTSPTTRPCRASRPPRACRGRTASGP